MWWWRFLSGRCCTHPGMQLLLQDSDLIRHLINDLLLRDNTIVQLLQCRLLVGQADLKINKAQLDGIILRSHLNRKPRR